MWAILKGSQMGKVLVAILLGVPAIIVLTFLFSAPIAWVVMLLLGVAHEANPDVPALGFLTTWILVFIVRITTVQNNATTTTVKE